MVGYFADLGAGAVYLSPFFRASQGSTHGYDVIDHRQLDPKLGEEKDFRELAEHLRREGLGLVVDIVPNHMGIDDPHNRWWQDVLENGPGSTYAKYFDIDWNPPKEALWGKVLLPVLGDQFGKVLEDQQVSLAYEDQRFVIRYYDRRLANRSADLGAGAEAGLGVRGRGLGAGRAGADGAGKHHHGARALAPAKRSRARGRAATVPRERGRPAATGSAGRSKRAKCGRRSSRRIVDYNGRRGDAASFDQLEALLDRPALSALLLARRHRRDQLSPLLRRRRAGGHPRRGPRGVRRRARDDPAFRRTGLGDRPADRSCRWTARPTAIPRHVARRGRQRLGGATLAGAAEAGLYIVVEKILGARREPADRMADRGNDRLRLPESAQRTVRRSPRRIRHSRRLRTLHRSVGNLRQVLYESKRDDPGHLAVERAVHAARTSWTASRSNIAGRAISPGCRCIGRCARWWPAFRSIAPTSGPTSSRCATRIGSGSSRRCAPPSAATRP